MIYLTMPSIAKRDRDIIFNDIADSLTAVHITEASVNKYGDTSTTENERTIYAEIQEVNGEEFSFQEFGVDIKVGDAWGFFKSEDNVQVGDYVVVKTGNATDTWTENISGWSIDSGSISQSTDFVIGNYSIDVDAEWDAHYTKIDFSESLDASNKTFFSFFGKLVSGHKYIEKIILGMDDSNYFVLDVNDIAFDDMFRQYQYKLSEFVMVGTPLWNSINYIKFEFVNPLFPEDERYSEGDVDRFAPYGETRTDHVIVGSESVLPNMYDVKRYLFNLKEDESPMDISKYDLIEFYNYPNSGMSGIFWVDIHYDNNGHIMSTLHKETVGDWTKVTGLFSEYGFDFTAVEQIIIKFNYADPNNRLDGISFKSTESEFLLDALGFYNSDIVLGRTIKYKIVQKVMNDPLEVMDECKLAGAERISLAAMKEE